MSSRQALFQRISTTLIVPITFLPLAALLVAIGSQLGIEPIEAAGQALIRSWLPLFYGIGVAVGFAEAEAMGALSVASGFLVMVAVAEAVSGDPKLNVGVLGGLIAGAVCTWVYNRVKHVSLPEFLALFSGKRMGPIAAALAGVVLGYGFGALWPSIYAGVTALGLWITSAGGVGAFIYGAVLRVLVATGLHHILLQLVDTQVGTFVDPETGKVVAGEYLRFLVGDPQAGRILSGFFFSVGFGPVGTALAITHEARPEQRRRVAGLMTTAALTAVLLGVTEPLEFVFIFISPVLFALNVVLGGLAQVVAYAFDIHLGGYALPMILLNWSQQQNGWLLFPLGLAFTLLYYVSFRLMIRWLRPAILGQVLEAPPGPEAEAPGPSSETEALLEALGGAENIKSLEACMTRLRLVVGNPDALDEGRLRHLGATGVLRQNWGEVHVVMGARAGLLADKLRGRMGRPGAALPPSGRGAAPEVTAPAGPTTARTVTIVSPFTGRVVPLAEVPDPVFAEQMAGEGVAVEPAEGTLHAPASGTILHIFPGGHALGIVTPEALELLVHVGLNTVALKGEGFALKVAAGEEVSPGKVLGHVDLTLLTERGKPLVTPVLITNPDRLAGWSVIAGEQVRAGEPLLELQLKP